MSALFCKKLAFQVVLLIERCGRLVPRFRDVPRQKTQPPKSSTSEKPFGKTSSGQEVYLYTLSNSNGLEMQLTDYVAR